MRVAGTIHGWLVVRVLELVAVVTMHHHATTTCSKAGAIHALYGTDMTGVLINNFCKL